MPETYPFSLQPLPYDYNALEPYIDTATMHFHHDAHLKAYVDKLNRAILPYEKLHTATLTELLTNMRMLPKQARTEILQNAGGVYNHNFFFSHLAPPCDENRPAGMLAEAIDACFGSFEQFAEDFTRQAMGVFGSGWAWLVAVQRGKLAIFPTANQVSPISYGYFPIAVIDVWEHAYYLKHQNRRDEYTAAWWHVANWKQAEEDYTSFIDAMQKRKK